MIFETMVSKKTGLPYLADSLRKLHYNVSIFRYNQPYFYEK